MDFKKKGWFQKYIRFRKRNPIDTELPTQGLKILDDTTENSDDMEQSLYVFLQPTGLLYGFPVNSPFEGSTYPNSKYYDSSDKAQLIFLESLISCLIVNQSKNPEIQADDYPTLLDNSIDTVVDYFINFYGRHEAPKKGFMGIGKRKEETRYAKFERILKERITIDSGGFQFYSFFNNCLLFLDLFFCVEWLNKIQTQEGDTEKLIQPFLDDKLNLRIFLLRVITAAAHANGNIEDEEQKIFNQFIKSARLPKDIEEQIKSDFKNGVKISDLKIPPLPWLLRKFFLELALLTVMSDRLVEDSERSFINDLAAKMDIREEDLEQSYIALESFLLSNESSLHFLQKNQSTLRINKHLKERMQKAIMKNKDRIMVEIEESKELYTLIKKSRRTPLNAEEKKKVREQLLDILKTIPPLVIIALPFTFITLPIILKILPPQLFPSAFQDRDEEE